MLQTTRFEGAPWFESVKTKPIIIGGAGGLGSWLSLWLSRSGCEKVALYDPDIVEEHNLAGQCFMAEHISLRKVDAVKDICIKMGVTSPYIFPTLYEDAPKRAPFMFSCFDSMKARAIFFEAWKSTPNKELFLDARLSAEYAFIYTVTNSPEDIEAYEKTLVSDAEIPDEACTYKQTSPIAAYATSRMWQAFVNYCSNMPRRLIFKETYRGPLNQILFEGETKITRKNGD
jgi:hypothetical protein